MLSEYDIETWLDSFEPEVKKTLLVASRLEDWVVDADPEIIESCNLISKALSVVKSSSVDGEKITEYDYSKLNNVSLERLSVLQGQLGLVRAIKLFGDLCYSNRESGLRILSLSDEENCSETTRVATKTLNQRIHLIIYLQLIDRIFSQERLDVIKDVLRNQFSDKEANNE